MVILRYNKSGDEWLEIERKDMIDTDFAMNPELRRVLDRVRKRLDDDYDFMMIIAGPVGTGKSNLGRICARYITNDNFHPRKHMIQDVNDIQRVIGDAKKGDCIIFDEGSGIFASADALTKKTKHAQLVLDVCRQKNLCLIAIAPAFHRLSSAIAIDRSTFLLQTYTLPKEQGKRGRYKYYGPKGKEKLYLNAKKTHGSYGNIMAKWRGTVSKDNTFTEEYRKFKDETLKKVLDAYGDNKPKPPTKYEIERKHTIDLIRKNKDTSTRDLAILLGISERSVQRFRQRIREAENGEDKSY